MIKTILKKYTLPVISSIIIFTMISIIKIFQNINLSYIDAFIAVIIISLTSLIRVVDDVFDYECDIKVNKKTLPLFVTLVIGVTLFVTSLILSFIVYKVIGLLFVLLYMGYLMLSYKLKSRQLKIMIVPFLVLISFIFNNLLINEIAILVLIITIIITIILSSIFSLIKKG